MALTDQTRLETPTVSAYKYLQRQMQNSCYEKKKEREKEKKEKKKLENKRARRKGANLLISITLGE